MVKTKRQIDKMRLNQSKPQEEETGGKTGWEEVPFELPDFPAHSYCFTVFGLR